MAVKWIRITNITFWIITIHCIIHTFSIKELNQCNRTVKCECECDIIDNGKMRCFKVDNIFAPSVIRDVDDKIIKYGDRAFMSKTDNNWGDMQNLTDLRLQDTTITFLEYNLSNSAESFLKEHEVTNPFFKKKDLSLKNGLFYRTRRFSLPVDDWITESGNLSLLFNPPETTSVCNQPQIITIISVFTTIFILSVLCFLLRFRIKLAFYKFSTRRKVHTLLDDIEFDYDIFVSYSYGDLSWVKEYAIPKLEQLHHFRLCIQDRDLKFGTVFSTSIIKAIRASSSVMFILSDNFAKDQWCKFQLDITNFINIGENNRIKIIPVMLDHGVSFKHMNEPIFEIINSRQYLQWHLGGAEERLFWISIVNRLSNGNINQRYQPNTDAIPVPDIKIVE